MRQTPVQRQIAVYCFTGNGVRVGEQSFRRAVRDILLARNGWRAAGVQFVFSDRRSPGDVVIELITAGEIMQRYGAHGGRGMSATECHNGHIRINERRWRYGPIAAHDDPVQTMSLRGYQSYLINHEMGHILLGCTEHDHQPCTGWGRRASVMQQHTKGVSPCRPTATPTAADLARIQQKKFV
jgi:hypothetical protein